MVDRAGEPPDRLLRRGDVHPGPLVQRAAQRLQHPLRAARSPLPGRGERVAPGQPRRHRHRDHARQGEPHAPPVPRVRQLPQPLPQRACRPGGQRIRCEHVSSSDRLDGQRSHLTDGDLSNPCPTGAPLLTTGTARCNPPDSPLSSRRHPRPREQPSVAPSPRQPDSGYPARRGPESTPGSQSRNVADRGASLITHRHIYFAGTLGCQTEQTRSPRRARSWTPREYPKANQSWSPSMRRTPSGKPQNTSAPDPDRIT